jgi:hypothetical protein
MGDNRIYDRLKIRFLYSMNLKAFDQKGLQILIFFICWKLNNKLFQIQGLIPYV